MIVAVCGGREFRDYPFLKSTLNELRTITGKPWICIVHGGARGADSLAGHFAHETGIQEVIVPANWSHWGRGAGFRRNQMMLSLLKPDLLVAFSGGRGTADAVARAERADIRVIKVK